MLIRNLQSWRSELEALQAPDVLTGPDRRSWSIWDVERFYAERSRLPAQQRTAIELCLFENRLEREAAIAMDVAATNPVAVYATVGLTRLLALARAGVFPSPAAQDPESMEVSA